MTKREENLNEGGRQQRRVKGKKGIKAGDLNWVESSEMVTSDRKQSQLPLKLKSYQKFSSILV